MIDDTRTQAEVIREWLPERLRGWFDALLADRDRLTAENASTHNAKRGWIKMYEEEQARNTVLTEAITAYIENDERYQRSCCPDLLARCDQLTEAVEEIAANKNDLGVRSLRQIAQAAFATGSTIESDPNDPARPGWWWRGDGNKPASAESTHSDPRCTCKPRRPSGKSWEAHHPGCLLRDTGSTTEPPKRELPPHEHTIEPGEINRRGCRRCEIERAAEPPEPTT